MDCFPTMACRCCECRGIHCLVWHPGHSHRTPGRIFDEALLAALRTQPRPRRADWRHVFIGGGCE